MDKSIVPVNQLAVRSSTGYEFSNPNGAEVVEIENDDTTVGIVEKQIEDLKLNHQFNEKDVPGIFKTLINDRMSGLKDVYLAFNGSTCVLEFDDLHVCFEKKNADWTVTYKQVDITIETSDPEKSIIDHLWFVLKNPNIKLKRFRCEREKNRQIFDSEKVNTLLQSMLNSIDHQIHTKELYCEGLNEDILLSLLKQVKPGTLKSIGFDISWKEEGNYQKMKEIVEMDQWKQAKHIVSRGVTPLKVDDLFHCAGFHLVLDSVTPEDVLRVVEHVFNSPCPKRCGLSCQPEKYDIGAVTDLFLSQNDVSFIVKLRPTDSKAKFAYKIVKSDKKVFLVGNENYIIIDNI